VIKYSRCSFHVGEQHKYYTLDYNATFCHSLTICTQHVPLQHSQVMHFPNFPASDHVHYKKQDHLREYFQTILQLYSYLAMVTILFISFYPPSHQRTVNRASNRIPVATNSDYELSSSFLFLNFRPKICCVRNVRNILAGTVGDRQL
jgi:hypothetical protein